MIDGKGCAFIGICMLAVAVICALVWAFGPEIAMAIGL